MQKSYWLSTMRHNCASITKQIWKVSVGKELAIARQLGTLLEHLLMQRIVAEVVALALAG